MLLATGVALIAYALYKLSTNHSRYFEDRRVKYKGAFSGIKNLCGMFFGKKDFFEIIHEMYNSFPREP